ncbi:MAG: DUF475 domain-containing protein [Zoogloeaceae bacterium]|jgi:hypothetical protein|nr:DUF475 domain-containing protein [Zoogloeaceae bacterium]
MRHFRGSFLIAFACLLLAAWWGGGHGGVWMAVGLTLILSVLEVSLSFDNAVVNASVLREMDERWQRIFLTVGILIAVFGMRLFFPVAIVSAVTSMGMTDVARMALHHPEEYARHLAASHVGIAAFGGVFLLLIFFSFLFNEKKELHWLGEAEKKLARLGKLKSFDLLLVLLALLGMYEWAPLTLEDRVALLVAGLSGAALFIALHGLDRCFSAEPEEAKNLLKGATRNGLTGFLYLEALDASFSFDGVIGAFALTRDVVIIMLGLGIGAMFVRSLTVYLVRKGTLENYVFLEHGAHYAIGALAVLMLAGIVTHIPEVVTGLVGAVFIALSVVSSVRYQRALRGGSGKDG